MSEDPEERQRKIRELEAQLAQLKAQTPAYDGKLAGDGAIAQGNNAKAVAKDGMLVEGDYIEKVENILADPAQIAPESLRAAYLNHLFESVSQLQLSGIDPKTASDAEARLNLGVVYTALLTLSPEVRKPPRPDEYSQSEFEDVLERSEPRRSSALEHLNRHARLVLLGDPGGGKSTFVNFVAMCLAGEALQRKDANLYVLTAPLPEDEDEGMASGKKKEKPQPWKHGVLLPMRVILRDFAARGLPLAGEQASAKTLWDFLVTELDIWALRAFEKPLAQELHQKGGLLLLDGLDEVPEAEQRRAQIKQAVEGFAASFPKCRILVTSRTYAYQKQDWRLSGFAESVLAAFSRRQIRSFVERWYAHIAAVRRMSTEDAQGRAELLKRAIFNSDRLIGLAERPLLLTLMASLHAWRGGTLPEKREELYADAVNLLLDWWESPKAVRNGRGELLVSQPSLAEWLKVDREKVRDLLEELVFKAHSLQQDLMGTADLPEGELVAGLMRLSQNPDLNPRQLVEYLSVRAGLLIPRGVGVYTFPHRTFQEYLAACYLTDHDYPEQVAELACSDINRWREVALLSGAKAARGTASAIWNLVDALCYADPANSAAEKQQWGAHLAGQALVESGSLNQVTERNQPKHKRVQNWLVQILESGRLPALERTRAGNTLAALGDPRFDPQYWYLPFGETLGFVRIPAGKFIMGADNSWYDSEKPQHELDLPYDYWLGQYPVTVAQYRTFVEASGYKTHDENSLRGILNHPVVWVTWYDALEYCKWLNEQLSVTSKQITEQGHNPFWQGFISGKLHVGLPSEAEWEKAARSTDGRKYPWGEKPNPNKANYKFTEVGNTSSVGSFPNGKSPYGLLDMSGNVWEWTCTIWNNILVYPYPYQADDGRENLKVRAQRVLRGGAFLNNQGGTRCACRHWSNPSSVDSSYGFRVLVSLL